MHRKRVICELHDSYFRLLTIKHAIPKTEWAMELLYNSMKTGSQWVLETRSWKQDVVEKASTQQKAGPPGLSLSSPGELMAIRVGVNMLQFCSVSNSLSHFQKKWEVYFFKGVFARLYYCVVMVLYAYVYVLCFCIVNYGQGYCVTIQHKHGSLPPQAEGVVANALDCDIVVSEFKL